VDEYHRIAVRAPASVTFAAARELDLMQSPVIRGIFWLRALPTLLRGRSFTPTGSRGLVEEMLALGWGMLAKEPEHHVVVGGYTQPWRQDVTFHALPPERFAAFSEPGYVKIVWTISAEPVDADRSLFVTRTRAVATDPVARRRFRRYWAPMSAGILVIRYLTLLTVKREAERRLRRSSSTLTQVPAGQVPSAFATVCRRVFADVSTMADVGP
jgi:hypothetical protein